MSELVTGDFNYGSVDPETATKLEYFAKSGKALLRKSQVQFIADMGKLLSEARDVLANNKNGTFIKWAVAEFDISKDTVYHYVNAWDRILSNGSTIYLHWSPTALYLASSDDFPKPVMKKLEKIPATDLVRTSDVKRLIAASTPKPEPAAESHDNSDDVPFDSVSAPAPKPLTQAELKLKEREAAKAANLKAKAEAKAIKDAEKAAAAAKKLKEKEDAKQAKAAAKAKEKADAQAALPKDEQAKLNRSLAQKYIDAAVRAVDDLHRVKPNQTKRMAAIKILQGVELW